MCTGGLKIAMQPCETEALVGGTKSKLLYLQDKPMNHKWNIFFSESVGGGRKYKELYERTVKHLQDYGVLLSQFGGDPDQDEYMKKNHWSERELHDQDLISLEHCDVLVAECSNPSLGVGYEIANAVHMNKRILILCLADSDDKLPSKIRGLHNGTTLIVRDYHEEELQDILSDFFSKI